MRIITMRTYLADRTAVGEEDECWPWLRSTGSHGYGQVWWMGEVRTAHSAWYEAVTGERYRGKGPEDLTIHHTCHNKTCCNPAHLAVITNRENSRMNGQRKQTHCSVCGDEYAGRDKNGTPRCRRCNNRRNREWYHRSR